MAKAVLVGFALVLAAASCSGQAPATFLPQDLMPGCGCMGNNSKLGAEELAKHGQNYGMWCAAWEDGVCTEPTPPNGSMVPNKDQGKHSCKGTMAKNCSTHWPDEDFSQDQSWCCDSWCYVDITTCTPEKQALYGITLNLSWTGKGLYYSYGACPDPWSQPNFWKGMPDGMKTVASYSQYAADTCPFTVASSSSSPPAGSPPAGSPPAGSPPAGSPPASAEAPSIPAATAERTHSITFGVTLAMSEKDFDTTKQTLYKLSVASAAGAGVSIYDVSIAVPAPDTAAARRLLASHSASVRVDTTVKVAGLDFANKVKAKLTADSINAELKKNDMPSVTMLDPGPKVTEASATSTAARLASSWIGGITVMSAVVSSANLRF